MISMKTVSSIQSVKKLNSLFFTIHFSNISCSLLRMIIAFQASDTISELEDKVDQLKKSLKDTEEHRHRQVRVSTRLNFPLITFANFN